MRCSRHYESRTSRASRRSRATPGGSSSREQTARLIARTCASNTSSSPCHNRTSDALPDPTVNERIFACLKGIATGDAIGKQTETLSRQDVVRWYPAGVRGFEGPPGTIIPRYAGNSKREWRNGEATDDTERTIAVATAHLRER